MNTPGTGPAGAPWRPLDVRHSPETAAIYDKPAPGVPNYLEPSLRIWFTSVVGKDAGLLRHVERILRRPIVNAEGNTSWQLPRLIDHAWAQAEQGDGRIILVDALLKAIDARYREGGADDTRRLERNKARVTELQATLTEAGSLWKVVDEPWWHLQRRVEKATQDLANKVVSTGTVAAQEIEKAWRYCYGIDPNFDSSYRHSVLAVEAAAFSLFTPNDPKPSLGKMISHLSRTHDRYTVANLDATDIQSATALLGMLKVLWHNHQRHITGEGAAPQPVTPKEAEGALSLAVTLVHWFISGLVFRKSIF